MGSENGRVAAVCVTTGRQDEPMDETAEERINRLEHDMAHLNRTLSAACSLIASALRPAPEDSATEIRT